ncbi:MAG: hypothetical protein PF961_18930 [Planctomycetota bacterium]|jgi:hypothetical protein|nr:hypothetical protein [Planctomycetota bacterium]
MGLFDELRRHIQEAIDEAQGQGQPAPSRRPRPRAAKATGPDLIDLTREDHLPPPPQQYQQEPVRRVKQTADVKAPERVPLEARSSVRNAIKNRRVLRRALVLKEVLGPPVGYLSRRR